MSIRHRIVYASAGHQRQTAAEIEREELRLAAERSRRELAKGRANELRDEVDRIARLLIDAPASARVTQAA